jgi:hypothetical protein
MPKITFVFPASLVLSIALLSSTTSPLQAQPATVRDSNGVAIVEYANPGPHINKPFQLGDRPVVEIGSENGGPELQFSRIAAIARLSDGSIAVADGASAEIRVFDWTGRFIRRMGRRGQAPGEFRSLAHLRALPADSLLAIDGIGARFTVFDSKGNVARTFAADGTRAAPGAEVRTPTPLTALPGAFSDGAFIAYARESSPSGEKASIVRDTLIVTVFSRDGAPLNEVGRFAGPELVRASAMSRPSPAGGSRLTTRTQGLLFGRQTFIALGPEMVYVGDGTTYEIRGHDRSGRLRRIIRVSQPNRPVTRSMIADRHAAAAEAAGRPAPAAAGARDPDSPPVPTTLPAFGALRVDAANRLWIKDYPLPRDTVSTWTVFDGAAKRLGVVSMPSSFEPMHIGADAISGVWRDESGVESVRVYPLASR